VDGGGSHGLSSELAIEIAGGSVRFGGTIGLPHGSVAIFSGITILLPGNLGGGIALFLEPNTCSVNIGLRGGNLIPGLFGAVTGVELCDVIKVANADDFGAGLLILPDDDGNLSGGGPEEPDGGNLNAGAPEDLAGLYLEPDDDGNLNGGGPEDPDGTYVELDDATYEEPDDEGACEGTYEELDDEGACDGTYEELDDGRYDVDGVDIVEVVIAGGVISHGDLIFILTGPPQYPEFDPVEAYIYNFYYYIFTYFNFDDRTPNL